MRLTSTIKHSLLKVVEKAAYGAAVHSANTTSPMWGYQTKLPEAVKDLRKF